MTESLILYDGVCGLCNRLNRFVLKRDAGNVFRFSSLQSETAKSILHKYGKDPADLDTVYLVRQFKMPDESLLSRSSAIVAILIDLGGFWNGLGRMLRMIPQSVRDFGYTLVAGTRYSIFGKYDSCPLPPKEWREKFPDV